MMIAHHLYCIEVTSPIFFLELFFSPDVYSSLSNAHMLLIEGAMLSNALMGEVWLTFFFEIRPKKLPNVKPINPSLGNITSVEIPKFQYLDKRKSDYYNPLIHAH